MSFLLLLSCSSSWHSPSFSLQNSNVNGYNFADLSVYDELPSGHSSKPDGEVRLRAFPNLFLLADGLYIFLLFVWFFFVVAL